MYNIRQLSNAYNTVYECADAGLGAESSALFCLGFLRAGLSYFGAAFEDEKYFTTRVNKSRLQMPLLAMGGEASFAPESALHSSFVNVAIDLTTFVIPKAGHWIVGDHDLICIASCWLTRRRVMRTPVPPQNVSKNSFRTTQAFQALIWVGWKTPLPCSVDLVRWT